MGTRRKARELAMQALYYMDIRKTVCQEALSLYCKSFEPEAHVRPFFLQLAQGVMAHQADIDGIIERFSSNWKLSRMACVDRNILRVAVYELFYCTDIPSKVSINEAIDIGKKFGTDDSGAFINGILDSIRKSNELTFLKNGENPPVEPKKERPS
jgi:N utilization substance protein B